MLHEYRLGVPMPYRSIQLEATGGLPNAEAGRAHPIASRSKRGGATHALMYGIVTYAVAVWLLIAVIPSTSRALAFLTDWMALPVQVLAALASARAANRWRLAAISVRACWMLLCAAAVLSIVSLVYWNLWQPFQKVPWLATGDILYLIDYALIGAALVALLALRPGTARSSLVWLDGLSIAAVVVASVWGIVYGPLAPAQPAVVLPSGYAFAYGVAATLILMLASLVWIRIPVGAGGRWIVALVVACIVQAAWIIGWIGSWNSTSDFLDHLVDYGDVICYSLIAVAALRTPAPPLDLGSVANVRRTAFVFLPTLAVLVSIALISGLLATHPDASAWMVAGLILLCVALLVTRHGVAAVEFERLRDELARREGDERISELVRQSTDAFMIATPAGLIGYASPAVEAVLGVPAARLLGTRMSAAFGSAHTTTIEQLLGAVRARPSASASLELSMPAAAGAPAIARVVATNRLNNARICGITLVVSDISKERTLEREVVEVANTERLRLAADVHDGVGQELTGIALLLQRFVGCSDALPTGERRELSAVVGHLNHAIREVRDLAHGLSPLYVVHGSLTCALRALAAREANPAVDVDVDPEVDDRQIDSASGEHLYRISAEAVQNARRHAACTRIQVSLARASGGLVLCVADNGKGYRPEDAQAARRGAGLRLMEYRARVIGAVLQIDSQPNIGTRVKATMLMRADGHAQVQ
jgi:PAS domain S-box-containing protein